MKLKVEAELTNCLCFIRENVLLSLFSPPIAFRFELLDADFKRMYCKEQEQRTGEHAVVSDLARAECWSSLTRMFLSFDEDPDQPR